MSDEENNVQEEGGRPQDAVEAAAEASEEREAEAPEDAPAAEPPEDAAPEAEPEAPAEPDEAEAPADEPETVAAAPSDGGAESSEAEEPRGPKERRKLERSRHAGEARPQRSASERASERADRRRGRAAARSRWRAHRREKRRAEPGAQAGGTPPAQPDADRRGRPRVRQGVVVSDRPDKTITVRIEVQRSHRVYGKVVRTSSTLHVHDERNEAHRGDTVRVVESRPLSRTKRWRLVEVLERAR